MIDLQQLKQFLYVVQRMNFTKAANDLYISHSTISRNISRLEEQLGTQLLLRNNRTVTLTPAGEHLAKRGQALLQEVEALEAEVRQYGSSASRRLHIAMFNFFNNSIFRHYEQFHRENPGVDMSIQYKQLTDIQASVANGDADIGITFSFALDNSPKYEVMPILSGEFVILASSTHPLANLESINIFDPRLEHPIMLDSLEYPFVSSIGQDALFQQTQGSARKVDSIDSFVLQIKAGMGIGILPEHAATQVGSGCSMISLDGVDSSYQVVMFWQKNTANTLVRPFTKRFIQK